MNREKQVCSLGLAKRLEELGVKQESLFWWRETDDEDGEGHITTFTQVIDYGSTKNGDVSAFTVAELGEAIPKSFEYDGQSCFWGSGRSLGTQGFGATVIRRMSDGHFYGLKTFHELSEADARAKMLIYLIENKLIAV